MKIALIHEHLISDGGAEQVLKAFTELWPEAPIYTFIYRADRAPRFTHGKDIRTTFLQRLPLGTRKYQWFLPLREFAIERFDLSEFDVVLSNSSAHAKGVITSPRTLHLDYCNTPTRYIWIHNERLDPLERIWPISALSDLYKKRLRKWDLRAASRVHSFIANSKNVQGRIQDIYRRPSEIIYPPVDTTPFNISRDQGNYYLAGGRLVTYKRYDIIVQAFNKLKMPLKIFGKGPDFERLRSMAGPYVEFLGRVSNSELPSLYARALAYIHPQEEDFGITPVESQAAGRPVIAYGAGGALETVVEGKTGKFFVDQDWEALADTVIRFKPADYDPDLIKKHAEQFSVVNFKRRAKDFLTQEWHKFQTKTVETVQ